MKRRRFRSKDILCVTRRYLVVAVYSSRSGIKVDKDTTAEAIMGNGYTGTGFDLDRGRRDISAEYQAKRQAVAVACRLGRAGFKVQVVDTRHPVCSIAPTLIEKETKTGAKP